MPPPQGTVERWAWDYIFTTDLSLKLCPPPPPSHWEVAPKERRIAKPGRPPELVVSKHALKTPGPGALHFPKRRAQLVHTFLHHELQAAELMAWAVLAFPQAPRPFRGGLIHIAKDEIRHMGQYQQYLATCSAKFGDYPVRDWFWERVPTVPTPAHFVAVLGIGFEGANLDHTARFAERFRAIGDIAGAELQERIGEEEIPHVRFAQRWFKKWAPPGFLLDPHGVWQTFLPPPLSPILMKGKPLNREARLRAGLSERFLAELFSWTEKPSGS